MTIRDLELKCVYAYTPFLAQVVHTKMPALEDVTLNYFNLDSMDLVVGLIFKAKFKRLTLSFGSVPLETEVQQFTMGDTKLE
jgi:hypothetical protein